MPFHRVGEMMHIDNGALDPGIGKPVESIIDQRLTADRDQRFWNLPIIGPHARAEARSEYYRAFWHHRVAQSSRIAKLSR